MEENTRRLETILTWIATALLMLWAMLIVVDVVSFFEDKQDYIHLYGLNPDEENWEWHYLRRYSYGVVLLVVGVIIFVLRILKSDTEMIRKIKWFYLLVVFGSVIVSWYNWLTSGPDY